MTPHSAYNIKSEHQNNKFDEFESHSTNHTARSHTTNSKRRPFYNQDDENNTDDLESAYASTHSKMYNMQSNTRYINKEKERSQEPNKYSDSQKENYNE